jgi:hypothetical protein
VKNVPEILPEEFGYLSDDAVIILPDGYKRLKKFKNFS